MSDPSHQIDTITRAEILGDRRSLAEIAMSLGCCERVIWNVVEQQNVPYIKFLGRRYVQPADIKAALLAREVNRDARKPGRPRKAA